MPAELQKIILECGKKLEQTERKIFQDKSSSYKGLLTKEGMVYTGIDAARATAIAADFHKSYMGNDSVMKELYDMILATPK